MEVESRHFSSIDSTNTWAKEHLEELDQNKLTIITADGQTNGRGQFNRKWISPAGKNIYLTFCFFMDEKRTDMGQIPQVLAVSVIKVLETFGFEVKIKWPNDLILAGKKVGGILCETSPVRGKRGIVLGIGLNVNMDSGELEKVDQAATSLANEKGQEIEIGKILEPIKERFRKDIEIFLKEGFSSFQRIVESQITG